MIFCRVCSFLYKLQVEQNVLWFFCNNCKEKEKVGKNTIIYTYTKIK